MSKGRAIADTPGGRPGIVSYETASQWQDIYEVSSIKNPKYDIGDKIDLADGRRFRYCLSTGQCDTFIANCFQNEIGTGASHVGIDWSALAASQAVGDSEVTMTLPASRGIAKDALKGGLISLNIGSGTNNDTQQMRLIIGNAAGVASGTMKIYLDAPLVTALVSGTAYGYCMPSPYSAVKGMQLDQSGKNSAVGYAAAPVSTSGLYHWEQTAGQISCSLYGSEVGKTQYWRDVMFRYDGNLICRDDDNADGLQAQRAGYIMDKNSADNGATVIMLQLEV